MQSQRHVAHVKEGDSDVVISSSDTSRWSSPCRLQSDSNRSNYTSDFEDQDDTLTDKGPKAETSDTCRRKKGKKAQGPNKQKTNHAANCNVMKLPPIKRQQVSKPGILSADLNCIGDLNNQVRDLKRRLSEARTENKLLKRLQHHHTVALEHFQESKSSFSQILTNHSNEARGLQGLLREVRACRDNLARRLQSTEDQLQRTQTGLQHLQQLSQDHSLLEREELTIRLTWASAVLEDKDKRILDLEKNLELCRASFSRQIATEQRKISEARNTSFHLQRQISQLNKGIQDRERVLETHNIYSHRFRKRPSKKERKSKMVQTDGLVFFPTAVGSFPILEYTETEERLEELGRSGNQRCHNAVQVSLVIGNPEKEVAEKVSLEVDHPRETETCADTSDQSNCLEGSSGHQTEEECAKAKEVRVLEGEQKTEGHESQTFPISNRSLNLTEPERKEYKLSKIRHIFPQSIENLHNGIPVHSRVDLGPSPTTRSPIKVETTSIGICELCPPAGEKEIQER
uniref:LOW QUALITY PROTEIN: lebercilin-like protein n=1 Tax=Gasterosteus aculeatus aculeatus TaxID=481459 RepID=UPI001A97EC2C|nr:LOW QUALITY PROTEIN: lebercilin-like protein [Gasterosteus aculeatus aculeatus]